VTTALDGEALIRRLPPARGRIEANRGLAEFTWFRAGGPPQPTRPISPSSWVGSIR
jgi:hypothetical protein